MVEAMLEYFAENLKDRSMEYTYGYMDAVGVVRDPSQINSTRNGGEKQSQNAEKEHISAACREDIIRETVELLREAPWSVLIFVHRYLLA
jgi:hypothetical protein